MDDDPNAPAWHPPRPGPVRKAHRNLVVVPLIIMVIGGYASTALFGAINQTHPLLLITLSASNRNLIFAAKYLSWPAYYAVGTLRLLAPDPLFYLLGVWYGDAAVRWMERQSATYGGLLRSAEQLFGRRGHILVFLAPNNPVCLFAGAAGMPLGIFYALNISGTIARLWLLRAVGAAFNAPLDAIRGFIADHRPLVIGLSVAAVALTIWSERRKGTGEALALAHLEEGITEAERELGELPEPDETGGTQALGH